MFYAYILFTATPFIILHFLGVRWALPLYVRCAVLFLIILIGFVAGLLFTSITHDSSFWKSYEMPMLWSKAFADSITYFTPAVLYFFVPWILLVDIVRLYLDFFIFHGSISFYIPQVICFYIIYNISFHDMS